MTVYIRRLERSELPAAGDVIRAAFGTVAEAFGLTEENCPTNGAFLRDGALFEEAAAGTLFYGAFEGGELAGVAALKRKDGALFYLEKLAVLPHVRRRGLGRALVEHCAQAARRAGGERLSIGVMYENRALVRWYGQASFVRVGTRTFPHLPFVVCFMERDLKESA